jgi:signal transduction histidine kinase
MSLKRFLSYYNRASLPLKISLSFTLMFLSLWLGGTWILGEYFVVKLDQRQREQAADLAALVEREFDQKLQNLRRDARLIAKQENLLVSTATKDVITLQQTLLPLKTLLETDLIKVVDQHHTLLDTRQVVLQDVQLEDQAVVDLSLTGADISAVVNSRTSGPLVMVGTAPIKDHQGVVGGLILGKAISHALLAEINEGIQEELLVVANGQVVASTLPSYTGDWQWLDSMLHENQTHAQNREFLAQTVNLNGLAEEHFDLVLLISLQPLKLAKRTLWLVVILLAVLGSFLITLAGYWLARKLAQPIQALTTVAQQVVKEGNFELQATVDTQDEIGDLAQALNLLITWVGQYTHDLEVASQTLEAKVDARTQELSTTLEQLQDTQAQLIQTEKMSSLGQMVAGIAHEINNPINFIQGNLNPLNGYFQDLLDLLETYQHEYPHPSDVIVDKQEDIDLDFLLEDAPKLLQSIKMGTQRVRDIVISLRNYSRLDEATVKNVNIHEGIEGTLLILNHRIKQGVAVIKDFDDLPVVRCSPAQLNQVFTNIMTNALDALFDTDCTPKQLVIATRAINADQVQISIRDNGPGMPPEVKAKIFDPFFTTKAVGKGTGLGLGICFKIIQHHQGTIEVHSAPGEGTEFVITLPIAALPLEGPARENPEPTLATV